jgi:putative SOS response-associated peptidase YedK
MCGRYTLHSKVSDLQRLLGSVAVPADLEERYNIAPTQAVPVVPNDGSERIEFFRWGLIPAWAKDASIGSRMINARAETVAEKPSFRTAFKKRRCLVPADGFYEWRKEADGKTKTPVHLRMRSGEPFAFAGLWESWTGPDGQELRTFTIITTTPNELAATVHQRMPVILPHEHHADWIGSADADPRDLQPLLVPYPAEEMEAVVVSRLVNSPRNDSPDCLMPA